MKRPKTITLYGFYVDCMTRSGVRFCPSYFENKTHIVTYTSSGYQESHICFEYMYFRTAVVLK